MSSDAKEFELEPDTLEDLDDGEQNLEEEAIDMLKSWNRETLLKEVADDRERIKRENENKVADYYDGEADFDTLILAMNPVLSDQVYIRVIEPNPSGKKITLTNTILFDRSGYLEHEVMPFESSVYDGKPSKLSLIEGPVLPGMLQALICLREGERAEILIKPDFAFGQLGCIPLIPENATLFYHVKIYKVWEESELNQILEYERIHFTEIPIEQKLEFVEKHKIIANKYLEDDMPREAIVRYKAAIRCIDEIPLEDQLRSREITKIMTILLQNSAITFNKLGWHRSATKIAKRAVYMDPSNLKAYYQLAKARIGLSDYSGASKWIERAEKISPNNSSFNQLRLQLDFQFRDEKSKRDEIMKKMSRGCQ